MKVAVIPARGGSKRIPGKNIRLFAGKPLIGYSITAALESNLFDRVVVSTDSPEIASVAEQFGAQVPFLRNENLADDYSGTDAVVLDTLERLGDSMIGFVCCLYATAPFVRAVDLIEGYKIIEENNVGAAFTVTSFPAPIYRSLQINTHGRLEMIWPEYRLTRSQDLPEALHDAGQFYWARIEHYLAEKTFWSKDALPIRIPRYRVQDIDTMEDWVRAEKMYYSLDD